VVKENNVRMKKIISILVWLLLVGHSTTAQTWEEWFQQKKTQKKYLLQQIAALRVYFNYAKDGYSIVSNGITTVRNIKNGDFNLHRDFLGSLKLVNPRIKKYTKLADIIALQVRMIQQTRQSLQSVRSSTRFTLNEVDHFKNVFDNLLNECAKNIDELFMIIMPGTLDMKDDERLKRLDNIYTAMVDKYSFSSSFSNDLQLIANQRLQSEVEIIESKILNDLK
jgi:hypothetical protein